ncbi:MAG TPA: tRNA (adenosine(37)-N6)-threonylcarbamoyltransferase complex ATPase subunit type 1 TsaE [Gemmatimonadaceae bacterium]|nr:tRNA (adenosine(37)-N6)-threonylcarbamoyltransferase complex ATPase subunit type 1 TsaE [Gemmatimonadaceae bacterium]
MPDAEFSLGTMSAWGESLGARLLPPRILTLEGDLGTGKTTLVRAICRGYGVRDAVTSPTFAVVHEYAGARSSVFHLDLFRIAGPHELAGIGWFDVLASQALVLVEWPGNAGAEVPAGATSVRLAHVRGAPDIRRVSW